MSNTLHTKCNTHFFILRNCPDSITSHTSYAYLQVYEETLRCVLYYIIKITQRKIAIANTSQTHTVHLFSNKAQRTNRKPSVAHFFFLDPHRRFLALHNGRRRTGQGSTSPLLSIYSFAAASRYRRAIMKLSLPPAHRLGGGSKVLTVSLSR